MKKNNQRKPSRKYKTIKAKGGYNASSMPIHPFVPPKSPTTSITPYKKKKKKKTQKKYPKRK